MKQLKEEGYEIEAIQNKGYCLKDVPDVLGESEIKSRLHTRWAGQTLYYYDEIDSTNTQIKRLAEEDAPHGTLAVADYQSRGKGRRGRAWDSPHTLLSKMHSIRLSKFLMLPNLADTSLYRVVPSTMMRFFEASKRLQAAKPSVRILPESWVPSVPH